MSPVLVIVGAGPGLGAAVARRFGREGYDVWLLARSGARLDALAAQLTEEPDTDAVQRAASVHPVAVDVTDDPALRAAVAAVGERAGGIDVLHFNPSRFREKGPLELTVDELLEDLRLGAGGLLTSVQAALPFLGEGARVVATGSMAADRPWHRAASLGAQKAALRNLTHSLDASLAPRGVRAGSLTVNGTLTEEGPFSPSAVAEALYEMAHAQDWMVESDYHGTD